jgi:hypothetical protein
MAVARVVEFTGVTRERLQEQQQQMQEGERPQEVPATEIILLHDADQEKAIVVIFFDNEDDYRSGDQALSAMAAGDTPGTRTSVGKYDVAIRMSQ